MKDGSGHRSVVIVLPGADTYTCCLVFTTAGKRIALIFFFLIDLPQNQVASEEHQRLARVYFAAKTFQLSELCFQNFISFKLSCGVSFRLILSSFLLPSFLSFLQYFVFLLFIWRAFQGRRSFDLRGLLGRLILLS